MKKKHQNQLGRSQIDRAAWSAAVVALLQSVALAQVNSGSDGHDGALNPQQAGSLVIDMADHPDGIYQYTSVNIPGGTAVEFVPNAKNTPVVWLVQDSCVIDGGVVLNGRYPSNQAPYDVTLGARGGPGGWRGGNGGLMPTSGQGPGGGRAGYGDVAAGSGGYGSSTASPEYPTAGGSYGNQFLVPLLGGSGGGGTPTGVGGGGGGGAILIAASEIRINGYVYAEGAANAGGASGSGGAVRLIATTISGTGMIWTRGGSNDPNHPAGLGRVRFDAFDLNFAGSVQGVFTQGFQPIILPTAGQGAQLTIASLGGVPVSSSPTGVIATPDAMLSGQQNNPITIVVQCSNIPLNTQITVSVKPVNGDTISATGVNSTGTQASSTATVSLNMPRGGGIIYATATSN